MCLPYLTEDAPRAGEHISTIRLDIAPSPDAPSSMYRQLTFPGTKSVFLNLVTCGTLH